MQMSFVQRRQHVRFRVDEARVGVNRQRYARLGEIVDISLGGLAFRYVDNGSADQGFPDQAECWVSLNREKFQIENIAYTTVHDFKLLPAFLELRQRCLQFGQLTSSQVIHLEYVISHLTGGAIIDSRRPVDRRSSATRSANGRPGRDPFRAGTIERRSGKERRAHYH